MKGKIMYKVISILFALIAMHSLAMGIENIAKTEISVSKIKQNKICYDTKNGTALRAVPFF